MAAKQITSRTVTTPKNETPSNDAQYGFSSSDKRVGGLYE